ncbi:hypothetical protein [Thermogemmatispora tikiterensis]|uniref:Uncharacterized protein n=1 Tax=Thermogemmatispora tikiterensis TaxID=1825093 RepID=A0A328VF40_9CHLR|nr:hypothetical protein [Thermogemmatispora tikiterensis]RAQ96418.1 hypothetical protein A4R35_12800 [Thermogemmatispora tikiterensis]
MKLEEIQAIAEAVLYEGYLLYPYRHSALKNRQRWTYGVLYPRAYSEAGGEVEPWRMQTECLLEADGGTEPQLSIAVRFLQLMRCRREDEQRPGGQAIERSREGVPRWAEAPLEGVWEEGVERSVSATALAQRELLQAERRLPFAFPARYLEEEEPHGGRTSETRRIVREGRTLSGAVSIAAEPVPERAHLYKLRVTVTNTTPVEKPAELRAQEALLSACVSTHTILQVEGGAFVSLIEPPEELRQVAASCCNSGTWPVLVGEPGERDSLLSSPIILYDYPQIAPESPAPLFDGTEIDELLALRILTLTDEEKEQIRRGDARGRAVLEQIERLTPEQFLQLHGTIRGLRALGEAEP